jgi:BirA family biotin operon repressor/biotin-[acetyl-CoA-carboxylase] ligase
VIPIDWVPSTESTNTDLRNAPVGSTRATLNQRGGRGRLGRTWLESPGKGLALSIVVAPGPTPTLIPLVAGAALVEMLRERGVDAWAKWPNDVYIGDRKVAGILTEMPALGRIIVGLGVNVRHQKAELPLDTSTSLAAEGFDIDATDIADRWVAILLDRISRIDVAQDWIESTLGLIGDEVSIEFPDGAVRTGIVHGITSAGALRLDSGDPIVAGEITRLRPAR